MKKTGLNWWCDRAWVKFGLMITFVMTVLILVFWQSWQTELKVVAAMAALIPVHVLEEWVFPGGFHYQYNTVLYKSPAPDRYPMCRLSDMFTNLLATFLYIGLTIAYAVIGTVDAGVLMGTIAFCAIEVIMHTVFGIIMYVRLRSKGKSDIYGPGSVTAYLGFGVLGVISGYCMIGKSVGAVDWGLCAFILLFILIVCILIPESIIKRKDSKYYFESAGYYQQFLDKE